MPAVITFGFDPALQLAGLTVRWETVGIGAGILIALLAAALLAVRARPDAWGRRLHLDDLLTLAIAAVPGAVIGGRIGYVLIHLDYYSAHVAALVDPGQGGLELALAVFGGVLSASYIARVLDLPIGSWWHVAAIPLLIAIGAGKAAMAWGGDGQGSPSDASWATAYAGPGPWASLAPGISSHPSQLYEAGLALALVAGLVLLAAVGLFGRRDGRLLIAAIGSWLVGRVIVATTWRDPAVIGPLSADQVLSLALVALSVAWLGLLVRRSSREAAGPPRPRWPDTTIAERWRAHAD